MCFRTWYIYKISRWFISSTTQAHKKERKQLLCNLRSFLQNSSKMQQKWLILTKIDDKILRIYCSYPYTYGITFHLFNSIKSTGITERTSHSKKDKDQKFPIFASVVSKPSNISTTTYFFTKFSSYFSSYSNLLDPNFYWSLISFTIVVLWRSFGLEIGHKRMKRANLVLKWQSISVMFRYSSFFLFIVIALPTYLVLDNILCSHNSKSLFLVVNDFSSCHSFICLFCNFNSDFQHWALCQFCNLALCINFRCVTTARDTPTGSL